MNNKQQIDIVICSDLDYECLLAEITIDGIFIGLVTNEPGKGLCFELPDDNVPFTSISFDIFENALNQAKQALLNKDD